MNYNKINNLTGWAIFVIASVVYLSSIEPTTSFWDPGEYIATSYKLQVGHPPGAPFFQLLGRFFSMWVEPVNAAMMINAMSALSSSATILFLFWTITILARKIMSSSGDMNRSHIFAVLGAGVVGSLAYTFSDSFWFSAVEGEVYAMSSFFTAIVFWAILKWEARAANPHSIKWIVLIAFLIGLSIGVHLLNLLTIPAMVYVYYFRKYNFSLKGFLLTGLIAVMILGIVQGGVIPGVVSFAARFELFFVNGLGLPFNTGTIVYFIILTGLIIGGLYYTHKKKMPILNTITLCFTVLLIGYSSFFMLIIRANANTPINENNPDNAINLLSYLNREQYGDWPILRGQYYNAPLDRKNPYSDGSPVYRRDDESGKYRMIHDGKNSIPNYDARFTTVFPRMWSSQNNHVSGYKMWGNIKGTPIRVAGDRGETEVLYKPTFSDNLTFFFRYQVNWMYLRYFFWNFIGRQNENQGATGNILNGNWMSGIPFIDSLFLGSQENLPESLTRNKAMNHFYFLPFILGLAGLFYQFRKTPKEGWVIFLLFFFTGLAIVLYLNPTPFQPRERDYAFVGSFYAFAIWIGLGVLFVFELVRKLVAGLPAALLASLACLVLVPGIMAKEGWDDHDRSHRYTARDYAKNFLDSCAENAILFTYADNDTFPLWYVQEVEGYRTDVRIVCLSLLVSDWHIDQMKRKAYDSDPLPITFTEKEYEKGTRDYLPVVKKTDEYVDLGEIIEFARSPRATLPMQNGKSINYIPASKFRLPVERSAALKSGAISKGMETQAVENIEWEIRKNYLIKSELITLDILAQNNWERPVYFAITTPPDVRLGLDEYLQLEGLAYRLVPVKTPVQDGATGRIDTDILYDNVMNKFKWGGTDKREIWMDENNLRMAMNLKDTFNRLSKALLYDGKRDLAVEVVDRAMDVLPEINVPLSHHNLFFAETYYSAGAVEKANILAGKLMEYYLADLKYFAGLEEKFAKTISGEIERSIYIMRHLLQVAESYSQQTLVNEIRENILLIPHSKNQIFRDHFIRIFPS